MAISTALGNRPPAKLLEGTLMLTEQDAIAKAEVVLDGLGLVKRTLMGVTFLDDPSPEFDFLEPVDPHYIVCFKNLDCEEDCVVEDGNAAFFVRVDGASGRAKLLKNFE